MENDKITFKAIINGEESEPIVMDLGDLIDDDAADEAFDDTERAFYQGMICAYERVLGIADEDE